MLLASWLVHNNAVSVVLILLMSLWFFAWVGTLFLSSTRVIFAAAFDRILPDGAAQVSEKRRVPVWSLVLMLLPAVGLGALYSYNSNFHTYTLDATLVIAVTYLFSAIAVVILPWRKPDLWAASPASRLKLLGVPVIPAAGVITIGLIGYCLYEWLTRAAYGVNNNDSLLYMLAMYVLALVIYLIARVRPGPPGHRPLPDQQGDPGRVGRFRFRAAPPRAVSLAAREAPLFSAGVCPARRKNQNRSIERTLAPPGQSIPVSPAAASSALMSG